MLGVTADTNIYVSALNFGGRPLQFLELARSSQIRLSISEPILAEVLRVLRDKFGWDEPHLRAAEEQIRGFTEMIKPTQTVDVIKYDPSDNRILECAATATSDYIVSGDRDLLRLGGYGNMPIVKAAEVIQMLVQPGPAR